MSKQAEFEALLQKAEVAGLAAGRAVNPQPMVVAQADPQTGRPLPDGKRYYVSEGACGFAWVVVRPGTSAFAKYMVKTGRARKHWAGGVSTWVREFSQSVDRKAAYADAYAEVLQDAGIQAYSGSRLD